MASGTRSSTASRSGLQTLPSRARRTLRTSRRSDETQVILERIYRDLNDLWILTRDKPDFSWRGRNPFEDPPWSAQSNDRYIAARDSLGPEYIAAALHSATFHRCLRNDTDNDWNEIVGLVNQNKHSIFMFAITRNIPYVEHFNDNMIRPRAARRRPLNVHPITRPRVPHPHEVFLSHSNNIVRCEFIDRQGSVVMNDVEDNAYTDYRFKANYPRPKQWPAGWRYPMNPQAAWVTKEGPWPRCRNCGKKIVQPPLMQNRVPDRCPCSQQSDYCKMPLVEIKQFAIHAGDAAKVNRGVIALSTIAPNDILADYVGTLIHLHAQDTERDQVYLMELDGPPTNIERRRSEWEWGPETSIISAGVLGNWTRFINHEDSDLCNVEFRKEAIGGKLRIIAVATKTIKFGEQLLTDYGDNYFNNGLNTLFPSKKTRRSARLNPDL